MIQQKRFGRKVGLHSTVQIVRELKILMRRDAEAAAPAAVDDTERTPTFADAASHPDVR